MTHNIRYLTLPSFNLILPAETSILYPIGYVKTKIRPSGWHVLVRLREHGYNNQCFILNYGEPNRSAETMSAAFTDSTMKQALSKRLVEKHPMQETSPGVPCLPPPRTQTLSGNLEGTVRGGYPVFKPGPTARSCAEAPHS